MLTPFSTFQQLQYIHRRFYCVSIRRTLIHAQNIHICIGKLMIAELRLAGIVLQTKQGVYTINSEARPFRRPHDMYPALETARQQQLSNIVIL